MLVFFPLFLVRVVFIVDANSKGFSLSIFALCITVSLKDLFQGA